MYLNINLQLESGLNSTTIDEFFGKVSSLSLIDDFVICSKHVPGKVTPLFVSSFSSSTSTTDYRLSLISRHLSLSLSSTELSF
jgi:hypothetical protein